jgi:hypothetical protein
MDLVNYLLADLADKIIIVGPLLGRFIVLADVIQDIGGKLAGNHRAPSITWINTCGAMWATATATITARR